MSVPSSASKDKRAVQGGVKVPLEQQFARNDSTWQEGATAARAGKPHSACPYKPLDYAFVTWTYGWAFASHMKAKEDDEL